MRTDRRLVEVGLKEVLAEDMFADAGGKGPLKEAGNTRRANASRDEGREGDAQKGDAKAVGRPAKKAKEDDRARPITDFFTR